MGTWVNLGERIRTGVSVLKSGRICRERRVHDWYQIAIESFRAVELGLILRA